MNTTNNFSDPAQQKARVKAILDSNAYTIRPTEEQAKLMVTDSGTGENYTLSLELLQDMVNEGEGQKEVWMTDLHGQMNQVTVGQLLKIEQEHEAMTNKAIPEKRTAAAPSWVPHSAPLQQHAAHLRQTDSAPHPSENLPLETDVKPKSNHAGKTMDIKIPQERGGLSMGNPSQEQFPKAFAPSVSRPIASQNHAPVRSIVSHQPGSAGRDSIPSIKQKGAAPISTFAHEKQEPDRPNRYNPHAAPSTQKPQKGPSRYQHPSTKKANSLLSSRNLLKAATVSAAVGGVALPGGSAISLILNNSSGEETAALWHVVSHGFFFWV